MKDIRQIVNKLVKRYNTSCPFELCQHLGIKVNISPLPKSILGLYTNVLSIYFIYLNDELDKKMMDIICAHELGHYVLHRNVNSIFLSKNTLLLTSKLERDADIFAANLLIDDSIFTNKFDDVITLESISNISEIPIKYIELKYNSLKL